MGNRQSGFGEEKLGSASQTASIDSVLKNMGKTITLTEDSVSQLQKQDLEFSPVFGSIGLHSKLSSRESQERSRVSLLIES